MLTQLWWGQGGPRFVNLPHADYDTSGFRDSRWTQAGFRGSYFMVSSGHNKYVATNAEQVHSDGLPDQNDKLPDLRSQLSMSASYRRQF